MKKFPPFYSLIILLLIKTFIVGLLIYSEKIGLGPDEAQYWTWSQQLSIGYYSKPPGIAWQIALGTALFGNTELGVRFASLLMGFLIPLGVYALARACLLLPKTAFWAACIMAFSPLGFLASFLAITDGGLVLFWTLALAVTCQYLASDKASKRFPYEWIGLIILCGALFKWPMYLYWILIAAWIAYKPKDYSPRLFLGLFISLLGLLPSLLWNWQHDFPTFKHVFATVYGADTVDVGTTTLLKGNLLEFVGAQLLLLSPILFVCLCVATVAFVKSYKTLNSALQFCGASYIVVLLPFAFYSFFKKMQGNWSDFVYPAACVLIAWYACERSKKAYYWMLAGIVSSIALVGVLFSIPQTFKHNIGWKTLSKTLDEINYDPKQDFLFSDKYQMSSLLSFYGPQQKRAYFFNLYNVRKNQFSYWPGMEKEQVGKTGYFVVAERAHDLVDESEKYENRYLPKLKPYFESVSFLGSYPLVVYNGKPKKMAYIFKCVNYNGQQVPDTTKF